MTAPQADFWAVKRVLVTGHACFEGLWRALWLARPAAVRRVGQLARAASVGGEKTLQIATYGRNESHSLFLADSKSAHAASITPRSDLQSLVARIARWCCDQFRGESTAALHFADIDSLEPAE